MGCVVTLGVGRLEVNWGKNYAFSDHSSLFLPGDVALAPYFYADDVVEQKPAFVRPLPSVKRRLEMLGYTLEACRHQYESLAADYPRYGEARLTFEEFVDVLGRIDPRVVAPHDEDDFPPLGDLARAMFSDPEFARARADLPSHGRMDGEFFENIDPYVVLRLLAEVPENQDLDVVWRTEDVVEGGYVDPASAYTGVPPNQRWLVVTEGSSDGAILKEAVQLVAADVHDFFDFVDMAENYPFTGTGNLVKFCRGLARIRIQNRILVLLDNDTAGCEAYQQLCKIELPPTMRVTRLPCEQRFKSVRTLGPGGSSREDINGRAVAMECFLDIWGEGAEEPVVRWSSYNAALDSYQGALVEKERYTRRFFERRGEEPYDLAGLAAVWKHLIDACVKQPVRSLVGGASHAQASTKSESSSD